MTDTEIRLPCSPPCLHGLCVFEVQPSLNAVFSIALAFARETLAKRAWSRSFAAGDTC